MKRYIRVISDFPVDADITMGSVFYGVEHVESQAFAAPCNICDGEGQVVIRDISITCPMCFGKKESVLNLNGYSVQAFKVIGAYCNEVLVKGRIVRTQMLSLSNCGSTEDEISRRASPGDLDVEYEPLEGKAEDLIFSDYRRAIAYADRLRCLQEDRLKAFNERHKTEHRIEWRIKDIQPPDEDGRCWGNGECQDCPKAKWSSSELFTEEPRVIGCTEDDGR